MHKCNAIFVTNYGTARYIAIKWIEHNIWVNGNTMKKTLALPQVNKYIYLSHKYNARAITLKQKMRTAFYTLLQDVGHNFTQ